MEEQVQTNTDFFSKEKKTQNSINKQEKQLLLGGISLLELNILATIVYFDIFDYPITLLELWRYLLDCRSLQSFFSFKELNISCDFHEEANNFDFSSFLEILESSEFLKKRIKKDSGFYLLVNRGNLVDLRIEKEKISKEKYKKARKVINILKFCPFLKMIFVTSSLSINNSKASSDIDFLIVTHKGRLFIVRLYCLIILKILKLRPTKEERQDKFCLNFFVSNEKLCLEGVVLRKEEKNIDLHFAYWLSQFVLMYDSDNLEKRFYGQNRWLKYFFPNFKPHRTNILRKAKNGNPLLKRFFEFLHFGAFGDFLENFYQKIQTHYFPEEIKKRINKNTNVIIHQTILKFHINDRRREYLIKFLSNFKVALKALNIQPKEVKQKTEIPVLESKKKNYLNLLVNALLCVFIFFLPWQTRWIFYSANLNGNWEYGSGSLYGTEIILIIFLLLFAFIKAGQIILFDNLKEKSHKIKNLSLMVLLFLMLSFVSIFYAGNKISSLFFFIHLLEAVLFFFCLNDLKSNYKYLSWAYIFGVFPQSVISIVQGLTQKTFESKWLGMAVHDSSVLGTYVVENSQYRFLRSYGSLPHPNILAGIISLAILLLTVFYLTEQNKNKKIAILSLFVFYSVALFFTFSKSALICLIFSFFLLFIFKIKTKIHLKKIIYLFITLIFSLTVFSLIFSQIALTRIKGDSRLEEKSVQERISQYSEFKQIAIKNWYGTGIANYTYALHKLYPEKKSWELAPIHNVYLLLFAELGIWFLFIPFLSAYLLFKKIKNNFWEKLYYFIEARPLIICFIFLLFIAFFDHFLWTLYFGQILFWLFFSLGLKDLKNT